MASSSARRLGVLIVRDGWGRNPHPEHDKFNAIKLAATPNNERLLRQYPWTLIHTSGEAVGLPEGTMGNSEVGHQNLGAGRIVDQESVRITKAIHIGEFFSNEALVTGVQQAQSAAQAVHLLGIASDAGVHGLMTHLYACLDLCQRLGQPRVYLHLFMDGRDTGPYSGIEFVRQIEAKCREIGVGQIGSICGRYYAMDRDNRWERVERGYACLTGWRAAEMKLPVAPTPQQAVQYYYDHPTNDSQNGDEFIIPTLIAPSFQNAMASRINNGDTVIFYNYRGDRPREITRAFVLEDDAWAKVPPSPSTSQRGFDRGPRKDVHFVTLTAYQEGLPVQVAFPKPPKMKHIVGEHLSGLGLRQFRSAETEKFPHVTFFFNDYREQPFPGENRQLVPSPKVPTYDLKPQMSAPEVCEVVLKRLAAPDCEDFVLVNFANCDMVGHTGKLDAAIVAVQTVDACVGKIVDATLARGGVLIVTADHGNAEQMWDPENNCPHTAHTTYDVDCVFVSPELTRHATGNPDKPSLALRAESTLADIMPTLLAMMGLPQPREMTGQSLLR